jgi:ATP-dependent HslUV protease ATP-binding subunit HslU
MAFMDKLPGAAKAVEALGVESLTPRPIAEALDRYIVGQKAAKRAVAIAVRNRWRRLRIPEHMRNDVAPKNILMIGPTGVGKTEIARRIAGLLQAPFLKVEATKFTEVGYHGRDVDTIIRDLVELAARMVQSQLSSQVQDRAAAQANERLLDALLPLPQYDDTEEAKLRRQRTRDRLRQQLDHGELEDRPVEIDVEEKPMPVGFAAIMGTDQMDPGLQDMLQKIMPSQQKNRRLTVAEARKVLTGQEAERLIDPEQVKRLAVERAEQTGIVFLDELDKLCGPPSSYGPDVSRQGVQRDLLPIVEGSTVQTRYGPVRTDHMLFIAAGAFHQSKPSDLMPELQGRLPIRVELDDLTKDDFVRILTEPENALTRQQTLLMKTESIDIAFSPDAIEAMAEIAYDVNRTSENIGARRLYTVMEKVVEELSFEAPDLSSRSITIDSKYVRDKLAEILKSEDLRKFIL